MSPVEHQLSSLDSPVVKGTVLIRRVDATTGEIKEEIGSENMILASFWNGLLFANTNGLAYFPYSTYHYHARTYISTDASKPNPYETSIGGVLGVGTNHPNGNINRGAEQNTGWPYIEIHNLFSVTGTARTFYSIGLVGTISIPTNSFASPTTLSNHLTRVRLASPVTQESNDQLDVYYRLYFQEEAGSSTNPALWASIVNWAITQTTSTDYFSSRSYDRGVTLSTAGVEGPPLANSYHLPQTYTASSSSTGISHINIVPEDYGATRTDIFSRNSAAFVYRWGWKFKTVKEYLHGILFNEWWPRNSGYIRYGYKEWVGKNNGWKKTATATGVKWSGWGNSIPFFYSGETATAGPFHSTFNHSASSMKLVYDVNALPRTTWKATVSGTWPADDKYPLFVRIWYSQGGALDGTAKYKIAFCRTLSTYRGYARDTAVSTYGSGVLEGAQSTNSMTYIDRKFVNAGAWQKNTDLALGHTEYANSRFGNLGFAAQGFHLSDSSATAATDNTNYKNMWDVRKYPGLTMNGWWGYQTGLNNKTDYLGVEFRQLSPLVRKVWQKADIDASLTQIDWLHPCNGMPGELDEEKAIICDSTSGIYLINATTNTVTKLTSETGFVQAWYTRDKATGIEEYHALKMDGANVSIHSNLVNNFQGTTSNYWAAHGGSSGLTWFQAHDDDLIMLKSHWRYPHIYVGLKGSTTTYNVYTIYYNARTGAGGWDSTNYGYWTTSATPSSKGAEFFGDEGEKDTGFTLTNIPSFRRDQWRNNYHTDCITFDPNGLVAWRRTTYHYVMQGGGYGYTVKTSDTGFGTGGTNSYFGHCPWAAPHGYTPLPNSANPEYPHTYYGSQLDWTTTTSGYSECLAPLIFKGMANTGDSVSQNTFLPITHIGLRASQPEHGYYDHAYQTPGDAMANYYDFISNGRIVENGVEKYKGLIINGQTCRFIAPLFTPRTVATTDKYLTNPTSWPINPTTDTVILHPMRWDVYGWDSANSQWVKEEWAWNYDTRTWSVDPNTVFPGRPLPTGGGTHTLPGITKYPYTGLQITWENMRPANTVNPELGEWAGQYIYNGIVMDGVTDYTFSCHISNLPLVRGQISTTIPESLYIRVPECNSSRFHRLDQHDTNLHSVKINGVSATLTYTGSTPAAGAVSHNLEGFIFNSADAGKTFEASYVFSRFSEQDDPINWARVRVSRESITPGGSNDLLGGQSYKASATLVSEGWTMLTTTNPTSSFAVSASNYSSYLPNGFPVSKPSTPEEGAAVYAERIAFVQDIVGFFWTNGSVLPGNTDWGNTSNTSGPTYGGVQLLHDTNHAIAGIHSRVYIDGTSKTWLVFRVDHYYSTTANRIVWELWYDTTNPWIQHIRIGDWSPGNSSYTGTKYHGIHYRSAGTFTSMAIATWPNGTQAGIASSTSDINLWTPWGRGPDQWKSGNFIMNLNPFDI